MSFWGKKKKTVATNDSGSIPISHAASSSNVISDWYQSQTFIGWQQCATMAQHWLISAACEMPINDAVRRGWEVEGDSETSQDDINKLKKEDKRINIAGRIKEFGTFGRVYGFRVAIFLIDGYTAKDYAAPFNADGIKKGTYKGILMPDPQFITPVILTNDPNDLDFYEPDYWLVSGIKYHKSHCVVYKHSDTLGQQLKPLYMYGSVPLPQQIHEQVYQAINAISEGNKLLMTKRLWVQNGDIAAMVADEAEVERRLQFITEQRNNHGVQLIDSDDGVSQMETTLAGVEDVIDQQLQIVASIARIPVNRLMQNQLKGFAATGESEENVYHETLESIQEKLTPLVEKHSLYSMKNLGIEVFDFHVKFNPMKALSDKEAAESVRFKAESDRLYMEMGAIDSQEVRNRIIGDKDSGYNGLSPELDDGYGYDEE